MIKGIGNDIIEIDRIKIAIDRYGQRFLNRIFTLQEQGHCLIKKNPYPSFAGRFAAKEAVSKALGTGFSLGLTWTDIEILNDEKGKPLIIPSRNLSFFLGKDSHILISISHCKEYATAFATWVDSKV